MKKARLWGQSSPAVIGLLTMFCLAANVEAREITDMFGRHFSLSDHPRTVYSASPPDTWLLYALDPTMLAGLNLPIREQDKRYLHPHVLRLPLVGGTFGEASTQP